MKFLIFDCVYNLLVQRGLKIIKSARKHMFFKILIKSYEYTCLKEQGIGLRRCEL